VKRRETEGLEDQHVERAGDHVGSVLLVHRAVQLTVNS
jgi:hypothetical protein